MVLEILKGIKEIDGFKVIEICQDMGIPTSTYLSPKNPITVDHDINMIAFKIQDGPIKENGVNGCQVNTIIETAKLMLYGLNEKLPCNENIKATNYLIEALYWLDKRKEDREKRGVEGKNER